ncbi:MAG TPA: glycosyltransferase family 39 protein [Thermoanaerobaculia bacterium]|nr:glycosyltransferase family 39 protein [Thermoanaerobaculia bacterium]
MTASPGGPRALLLGSIASALLGQSFLTGSPLPLLPPGSGYAGTGFRAGVLFLLVAIVLAALSAQREGEPAGAARRAVLLPRPRLAGLAVATGLAAGLLFGLAGESAGVRLLWPAGALLFLVALWPDRGEPAEGGGPEKPVAWDVGILLALAAAGFVLRYVRLTEWPAELDGDFASAGLQVAALAGDPRWVGVGDSNLPLVFYRLLEGGTRLFGLNLHGLMISSAFFGTLSIGGVYLLGREIAGRAAGLLAAALLASSYTAIHFSRVILTPSAMLAVTLMLAFLLRGIRTGGGRWYALAGVTGGVACLLYFAGRVAPLIAVVVLLWDLARGGPSRLRKLRGAATMAVAALLTAGPMLVFYAQRPSTLVARGADVTVFAAQNQAHLMGKYGVRTVGEMLLEQTRRTFLTFHLYGDTSSEFGFLGPMVDTLTAAFLLVGLGLAFRRLRSAATAGLLAWIGGVTVVGGILTLDPPDWVHLVVALPAVVILSAIGMRRFLALWGESLGHRAAILATALLVAALLGTAADNWLRYRRFVEDNSGPQCAAVRWVDRLPAGTRILVVPDPLSWKDRTFRFYARGADGRDVTAEELRALTSVDRPTAIILTPRHAEELFPLLLRRFPDAEALTHFSHGWRHFHSIRIVPAGSPEAAPYDTLGKTSRGGWLLGLLAAALAATAPLFFPRRSGAIAAPTHRPDERPEEPAEPPPPAAEPTPRPASPVDSRRADEAEVRRPILLILGLLLAYVAQLVFDAGRPEGFAFAAALLHPLANPARIGLASSLLVAGGVLWWLALRRPAADAPVADEPSRLSGPEFVTLFGPALALGVFAALRFVVSGEDLWVRGAWAASLVAFLLAAALATRRRSGPREGGDPSPPMRWFHLLGLALVLAGAGWLRFHDLGVIPNDFHGDMASYGQAAREVLVGGETRLVGVSWAEIPRLGYQPTVLAMRVFGNDIRGLMAAAAVGGMLFLIALYALVWRLFDSHRLALLATAIAAGNTAHVHFSRIAAYMDPWPFCLGAFFFAVDGLRGRRTISLAISGILLGLGAQMYYSGRVAVFVLGAFLLHTAFLRRAWLRRSAAGLGALALGFILTLGPNVAFFLKYPHAINSRGRDVWLFTPSVLTHLSGVHGITNPLGILLVQIERTLLTFNHTIDTSTQFGYPHAMFAALVAPLIALGFARALKRWRDPGPGLLIPFFALILSLGGFLTVDAPFWPRLVGVVAPAAVFAALAIDAAADASTRLHAAAPRWVLAVAGAGLLIVAISSWMTYRKTTEQNARSQALIGRFLSTLPENVTVCGVADPFWLEVRETAFLAWPRRLIDLKPEEAAAPPSPCVTPPFAWVLSRNHLDAFGDLTKRFPEGQAENHAAQNGSPVFVSFRVPAPPGPGAAAARGDAP